jgi:hypothetical protein
MIYLDGSVALAYLLAEDRFPPDELWDEQLVSSRLLECEVWNRINAHRLQSSHGEAVRNLIGRVAIIDGRPRARARIATVSHYRADLGRYSPRGSRVYPLTKARRATRKLR